MHLAVDLLDRYFISPCQTRFDFNNIGKVTLKILTVYLISSKYDEIDDNIPLIKDLTRYFTRVLPSSVAVPSFEEVIECERELMNFFKWDLMIVTPTVILKLIMANGIVFDNEDIERS